MAAFLKQLKGCHITYPHARCERDDTQYGVG